MWEFAIPKSASSKATLLPVDDNCTEQFTAKEVFPTPPFPLAIAIDLTII